MSKLVKQMQMDALKKTFQDVRDLVLLTASGLNATQENQFRLALRKKNIHLQMVKNSLARRVFDELGIRTDDAGNLWTGPTLVAWGNSSLAELSRELDNQLKELIKKNAKLKDLVKVKTAIVDGQPVPFQVALTMPTRAEVLGQIIGMILGPASQVASQIVGPASQVASQIQKLSEKSEAAAAPATAG